MPRRRTALAALLSAAVTVSLAGCAGDSSTSDGDDGVITVYSGRNETLVKPLFDQFTAATGIRVEARYDSTAAMASQLLEEGDSTNADVFLAQDAGALGAVAKEGLFAPLPEEITGRVDEGYVGNERQWVGITGRSRVLVYDPEQVDETELPDSVLALAEDENLASRTAIAPTNGSFQAFVSAIRIAEGDEAAESWLQAMADAGAPTRPNNIAILEDVDAGTLEMGLINHYYYYELIEEVGADNVSAELYWFGAGDPGALVNVAGVGVLDRAAEDPEVARFVDYLLSEDAQRYFAEETMEYPLIGGIELHEGLPAIEDLDPPQIDLDDLDDLETTVRMITDAGLA